MQVGLFVKRAAGSPAAPADWNARALPAPTARATVAGVEEADRFGDRLRAEADRLGVTTAAAVTVLGDGAEWIWNLADEHLPQTAGVLDIYHALGHVAAAMTALRGDGEGAAARAAAGRDALLAGGKAGFEQWLARQFSEIPAGVSVDPLLDLAAYLGKHPTRLGYAGRLAAGWSIGSGAVEGGIKHLVNLRLKRTGGAVAGRACRPAGGTAGAEPHARVGGAVGRRVRNAPNERHTLPV